MPKVWHNGAVLDDATEASIAISDRGFTLADGIFETILARKGAPLWFADHMSRMRESAAHLGLLVAYDNAELLKAVIALLNENELADAAIRITLTRGPTSKRGLWVSDNPDHPTLLITAAPAATLPPQRLIIARSTRRNEHSPLSRIKSLNYGDNILARREALARGATDALMLNTRGDVVCATVGNVFARISGRWLTPPVSDGILPGLARQRLLATLSASERSLRDGDIAAADAVLFSNSLGCVSALEIEGRTLTVLDDTIWREIYRD